MCVPQSTRWCPVEWVGVGDIRTGRPVRRSGWGSCRAARMSVNHCGPGEEPRSRNSVPMIRGRAGAPAQVPGPSGGLREQHRGLQGHEMGVQGWGGRRDISTVG